MIHILVIDDSTTSRLYYRDVLETAGFAVSEAINGIDALERLAEGDFQLLLLDINMPRMDGNAFLAVLRGDPVHRALPVIMISTEAAAADRTRAYAAGANYYIVKPAAPDELAGCVRIMTSGTPALRLVA